MAKQPFLPLFFGDLLASTAEWAGEEVSLYVTLLGHQWSLGSLPMEADRLCRLVRWDRKLFGRCWRQVAGKFEARGGRLFNLRLEEHREKTIQLTEAHSASGRRGAEARWRKDGKANSEAIETPLGTAIYKSDGDQNSIPSHPYPSSLRSEDPPQPPVSPNGAWGAAPEGCDPTAWGNWAVYKRGRPAKQTRTKLAAFLAVMAPDEQRNAVDQSIRNGWAGLFPVKHTRTLAGPDAEPRRIPTPEQRETNDRAALEISARSHGIDPAGLTESQINTLIFEHQSSARVVA